MTSEWEENKRSRFSIGDQGLNSRHHLANRQPRHQQLQLQKERTGDSCMTTSYPPPPASSSSFEPMSVHSASSSTRLNKPHRFRFALAFFVLGLINNVLYVVILSAALDLVNAASTPKVRQASPHQSDAFPSTRLT